MKTIIVVFFVILFNAVINSNATCPPLWTPSSFTVTLSDGCEYTIDFCYTCGVTGADPSHIKNIISTPTVLGCGIANNPANDEEITDKIHERWSLLCTIPPCSEPPNPQIYKMVYMDWQICRSHHCRNQYGNHWEWFEYDCNDEAVCQVAIPTCVDYSTTPPTYHTLAKIYLQVGTPNCAVGESNPLDCGTLQVYDSNCFQAKTKCIP